MESYTYKWLPAVAEADSLFVACKKMSPVELLVEMHQLCWQGPLANVFSCSFASAWVCIHPYAMLSGLDIQHDGWLTPANCTHVAWTVSLPQTAPCRRAGHSGWSEGGRGGMGLPSLFLLADSLSSGVWIELFSDYIPYSPFLLLHL